MVKITIIMPSLNVARYIGKCMESVLNQTLKEIEVLAIDAGSEDGTWEILQSYAEKDARVRLIRSDKKSYGYQVNLGLKKAQGEYVGIVETDDWVEQDIYEIFYRYACEYRPDYIRGTAVNSITFTEELAISVPIEIFPKERYQRCGGVIQINPSSMKELFSIDFHLWNGIYDRGFLQGITLNESDGAAYQDMGFLAQVYCKAEKAVYIDRLAYYYRRDNANSSFYSRNAFRYLMNEYRFVQEHLPIDDQERRLLADARYFGQVRLHLRQMAEADAYWGEEQPYILQIQRYFREKVEVKALLNEILRESFELFLQSPMLLYNNLRKENLEWENAWRQRLEVFADREIVIYGSGLRGHYLHCALVNWRVGNVIGYCDGDETKWGGRFNGLPVENLAYWKQHSPDIYYAVTVHGHYSEIEEYLLQSHISQEHILIFDGGRSLAVLLWKREKTEPM